ncbi:MAG TPA: RagB/SusD family nutrient uptake outer membrane protein [Segetibacter sp.]|nr:RagB/SusD family nutrient uptake outer membrane protein [Segetibacter sp.]
MKKYFINGILGATLIMTISCSKQLETTPTESIDASVALKTSNDVKAALVGAYSDLGADDFYGGRIFMEADLLADVNELTWSGTYQDLTQIKNKSISIDNLFVRETWLAGYKTINDVNNILNSIGVVVAADSMRVSGEALFVRGASYFELVKKFAKAWNDGDPAANLGVPLVLTPTTEISETNKVARNTVAEVYQQVINDLTQAEAKLPETNGVYATKAAAAAVLARVYLQQGDYANAAQAADRAIATSGAQLTATYAEAFAKTNTKEDIFAIQVTSTSGFQGFNEFYSSSQRGDIQIKDAHLNLYDSTDDRLSLFYDDNGSIYTGKFEELYGNVHVIRLAEMMLIRAESNFRLGTAVGVAPVEDINAIRQRAQVPPYTAGELTIDKIILERTLELAFEGFRLDDIKRLQGKVADLSWNSPNLIFPIPKREIIANPNMVQNEGY